MKLRNKKTGEIGKLHCDMNVSPAKYGVFEDTDIRGHYWEYHSLAELNEEWEDYGEPKEWGYIDIAGEVKQGEGNVPEHLIAGMKQIGNYFETKEEAEKAVEKLKAWKRLKDKCFRFYRWNKGSLLKSLPNTIEFACDDTEMWTWEDIQDDLDLLFGGEE